MRRRRRPQTAKASGVTPAEIISHAVWLYYRFSLSFRDIEDLLAQRGIEASRQSTRQRERQMRRFKSPAQAQRFLSIHGVVNNLFRFGRHLVRAANARLLRERAFSDWQALTGT